MPYTRDGLEEKLQGEFEGFYAEDHIEFDGHFDVQTLNISFSPKVVTLSRPGDFAMLVDGKTKSFSGTLIEEFHVKQSDFDDLKNQHQTLLAFETCGRDVDMMNALEHTEYDQDDIESMMENYTDHLNRLIDHYGTNKVIQLYELED